MRPAAAYQATAGPPASTNASDVDEMLSTVVYMAQSHVMNSLLYCRMLIAVAGLVLSCLIPLFRSQFVAHGSLVMLVVQHCLWNLALSTTTLADTMITAHSYITWQQPDDLLAFSDGHSCFHRKFWNIYAVYGTVTSMFAITIERVLASRNYRTYEKSSRRLGYLLSGGSFLLASLIALGAALTYDFDAVRAHCFVVTAGGEWFHRPLAFTLLILELLSLLIFYCLLRVNQQRLSQNLYFGLSEKYQIKENVRALKLLVPVVISHITLTVLIAACFSVIATVRMAPREKTIAEASLGFLHAHAVIVPIFMFVRHRRKSKRTEKTSRINRLQGSALMNEHDKAIMKDW